MYPLVEFDRSPLNRERLFAFVLKWSDSLTLVQIVDDERFDLNGYAVFHNSTVRRWRDVNDEAILARALRANRVKPAMVRGLNLEDWPGLLKTATARCSPIAVFREKLKRYNFHAGRVVKVGRKKFDLLEIEPDATWDDDPLRYKLKDVTLVKFGTRYLDTLSRFSDAERRATGKSRPARS